MLGVRWLRVHFRVLRMCGLCMRFHVRYTRWLCMRRRVLDVHRLRTRFRVRDTRRLWARLRACLHVTSFHVRGRALRSHAATVMLDGMLRRSVPSLRGSRLFRVLTLSFMPREMLLRGSMLLCCMRPTFLLMPTLDVRRRVLSMAVVRLFTRARSLLGSSRFFGMRRLHARLFALAIAAFERCSRFFRTLLLSRMNLLAVRPFGLLSLSACALRFCHPRVFTGPRRMRSLTARTLDRLTRSDVPLGMMLLRPRGILLLPEVRIVPFVSGVEVAFPFRMIRSRYLGLVLPPP